MKDSTTQQSDTKIVHVSLAKKQTIADLIKFSDINEAFDFFARIIKGKKINADTPEEAMAIFVKANELGLGWANAADHMHVINGKTGVDIHIIKALLLRPGTGITWKYLEDFVPIYKYIDKDKNVFMDRDLPVNSIIARSAEEFKVALDSGKIPVYPVYEKDNKGTVVPFDFRTTIEFKREIRMPSGKWEVQTTIGTFCLRDAFGAGLHLKRDGSINESSPWIVYRKTMTDHRAFTLGARAIASDLLMGVYDLSELYDINKRDYILNKDGEVIDTITT